MTSTEIISLGKHGSVDLRSSIVHTRKRVDDEDDLLDRISNSTGSVKYSHHMYVTFSSLKSFN